MWLELGLVEAFSSLFFEVDSDGEMNSINMKLKLASSQKFNCCIGRREIMTTDFSIFLMKQRKMYSWVLSFDEKR